MLPPGPYRDNTRPDWPIGKIFDATGRVSAETFGYDGRAKAFSRRIVACLNALDGVPTDAIESGALRDALIKEGVIVEDLGTTEGATP